MNERDLLSYIKRETGLTDAEVELMASKQISEAKGMLDRRGALMVVARNVGLDWGVITGAKLPPVPACEFYGDGGSCDLDSTLHNSPQKCVAPQKCTRNRDSEAYGKDSWGIVDAGGKPRVVVGFYQHHCPPLTEKDIREVP